MKIESGSHIPTDFLEACIVSTEVRDKLLAHPLITEDGIRMVVIDGSRVRLAPGYHSVTFFSKEAGNQAKARASLAKIKNEGVL